MLAGRCVGKPVMAGKPCRKSLNSNPTSCSKPSGSPLDLARTRNRTALGGRKKYKGDRQSSSGGLTTRRLTVMKPHPDFPAEHKSSLQRRSLWAVLLLTVLVLGWIQTSSLLRRQHKLFR